MSGQRTARPRHTVVLDWDGCLVPSAWPEQPRELMPGALEAVRRFHEAGFGLVVQTARLTPFDPVTSRGLPPHRVAAEYAYIRDTLDSHGLTFVDIWRLPGKVSGSCYIDDKAERYNGRPGSWAKLAERVIGRLTGEPPVFPVFDQTIAEEAV